MPLASHSRLGGMRAWIVLEDADGTKTIAQVVPEELTLTRDLDSDYGAPWWHGVQPVGAPRIRLDGILTNAQTFTGDVPDEQRAIGTPRPAIERGA